MTGPFLNEEQFNLAEAKMTDRVITGRKSEKVHLILKDPISVALTLRGTFLYRFWCWSRDMYTCVHRSAAGLNPKKANHKKTLVAWRRMLPYGELALTSKSHLFLLRENPRLVPSTYRVTPVPGNPTRSSDLFRNQAKSWNTDIHAGKTFMFIK